ncbi:MAG TPA: glycogen synthase [Chloroflexota bacterium]|nr:glycogen synthase [Chloroflexota bacterium]HUM69320.1 glycogen synthase [Chloroflexota bacterium]
MADQLKILFLSAEVAPFAKTGGLGDVGGSLPKALHALGHDVRVMMPAYKKIEDGYPGVTPMPGLLHVPTGAGYLPVGVFTGKLPNSEVPIFFIAEQNLFNRPNIYGYSDDAYRFAFFSRAALELTLALDWKPDVLHAHDWHTAPAITWLSTAGQSDGRFREIASIFTIHNLAHQGRTNWHIFDYLGIQTHSLAEEGYGEVNFMARGIYHATMVNTVSPTYAREMMTSEGGAGLHNLLRHRHYDVHGILNGLDYEEWDPAGDGRIAGHYDADHLEARLHNRRALQARANLPQRDNIPLVAMVSRLDWQKGLDITGHVIHLLLNGFAGDAQFIVLGTGAAEYEGMFAQLAHYHAGKMTAILDYSAGFAPLIYAGSDMFIMPSRFEPCGLGQLIAMRYGSVPVVRATGGLVDTVIEGHTGFTFQGYSTEAFWQAMQRAIYVYNVDRPRWQQIQRNGMVADFSWRRSALSYQQLYEWAIARTFS